MVAAFIQKRAVKVTIISLFIFVILNIIHHDGQRCQYMDELNHNLFCKIATRYRKIRNNTNGFSLTNFNNISHVVRTAFRQQGYQREDVDLTPIVKLPDNLKCRIP
eukprot:TCONS_00027025-protein